MNAVVTFLSVNHKLTCYFLFLVKYKLSIKRITKYHNSFNMTSMSNIFVCWSTVIFTHTNTTQLPLHLAVVRYEIGYEMHKWHTQHNKTNSEVTSELQRISTFKSLWFQVRLQLVFRNLNMQQQNIYPVKV